MNDTISRQAAIDLISYSIELCNKALDSMTLGGRNRYAVEVERNSLLKLKDDFKLLPAQPETAKRIVGNSRDGMTLWYQCDMCNEPVDAQDDFCRGCGRRLIDE